MSHAATAEPTLDHLRQTLEQAGYRVRTVADPLAEFPYLRSVRGERSVDSRTGDRLIGVQRLFPGCAVSLQFGDQIAVGPGDTTRLTVRGSLRISGEDDRLAGTTCWQIHKSSRQRGRSERPQFAIEADVILGKGVTPADVLNHGRDVYRHLRLLISDAREALYDHKLAARGNSAAVLRIEANFLGALAIGRSGIVASDNAGLPAPPSCLTAAACGWLKNEILPELARAIRTMVRQASHPWPQARPPELGGDASIVPAMEPVQ